MIGNEGNAEGERLAVRETFLKKRRFFMLTSLIVLFVELSQVRIEKLNVLGNEIVIDNPSMVAVCLWGGFVYFGLMYFYYFRLVDKASEFEYRDKIFKRTLFDSVVTDAFVSSKEKIYSDYFIYEHARLYALQDSRIEGWAREITLSFPRSILEEKDGYGNGVFPAPLSVKIGLFIRLKALLISNVKASLHTKYFLESYLPFALGIGVVMFKLILLASPYCDRLAQQLLDM